MGWTLRKWKADLARAASALRAVMQQPDAFWRYQAALLLSPHVDVMEVAPVYLDTVGTWAEQNLRTKPLEVLEDLVASQRFRGWSACWNPRRRAPTPCSARRRPNCSAATTARCRAPAIRETWPTLIPPCARRPRMLR